jgi:hypothetical protein
MYSVYRGLASTISRVSKVSLAPKKKSCLVFTYLKVRVSHLVTHTLVIPGPYKETYYMGKRDLI